MGRYVQLTCKFTPEQYAHLEAVKSKYKFGSTYELVKLLVSMLLAYTDYECKINIDSELQRMIKATLKHLQADLFSSNDYQIIVGLNVTKGTKNIKAIDKKKGHITMSQVRLLRLIIDNYFPPLSRLVRTISNADNYAKILADSLTDYVQIINDRQMADSFTTLSERPTQQPLKRKRIHTINDEKK